MISTKGKESPIRREPRRCRCRVPPDRRARKTKDGAWYAAGITNKDARDFTFKTSFLDAGEWTAEVFRDADGADAKPTDFVHETRTVKAGEALTVHMASGGGFVVRFSR